MEKVAFITGSSTGIGKAISDLLLSKNYRVFGYSRTNTIQHPKFIFTKIDLSNVEETQKILFPKIDSNEVLLINNAASIGEILPLNLQKETDIIKDYNLNIITPTILCSKFINSFNSKQKILLNISSGAANSSIACWATYCATKSALDRLTNVLVEENHCKLKTFSVHPGVVNTKMQERIRSSDPNVFPLLHKFTSYYSNNELEHPKDIARKLYYIIKNHTKFHQNILSIRDIDIN